MRGLVALAALATLAAGAAGGARRGQAPPAPVHTRVNTVRLDVIAADARGHTVDTLRPSDFQLREAGVVQTLDDVKLVAIGPRGGAAAGAGDDPDRSQVDERTLAARGDGRLIAVYLDEYHIPAASTARVREIATRLIERDLGPRDLLVVMRPLDSLSAIRLRTDRDGARRAVGSFEGRQGDYEARTDLERTYIAGAPARLEQMRAQVTISALNALAAHLGALGDGRKTLVVVTGGLGPHLVRRRGLEPLPTVETVIRAANRANVSIYSIDPAPSGADASQAEAAADLRSLSEQTDGQRLADGSDLDAGVHRMLIDASVYYLLTYRSAHADDGAFREVEVRVSRPGVIVRARKGYFALFPDEVLAAQLLARAPTPPAAPVPATHVSQIILPWFGMSRGDAGKTRVLFVWEPVERMPGDRSRHSDPIRLVLTVLGANGDQLFEGVVLPVGGAEIEHAEARAVFDAPPGRVRVRMSIEDAGSQVIDSDVRDVPVRDLKGPVIIGTPEILRTRNARERRAVESDPNAVPVASRVFSRTEQLLIRFRAYAPESAPSVTARLMSRMGQEMRALAVRPSSPAEGPLQIDLPLAGLAPGEYLIEVAAASPAGVAKERIGFRVTS